MATATRTATTRGAGSKRSRRPATYPASRDAVARDALPHYGPATRPAADEEWEGARRGAAGRAGAAPRPLPGKLPARLIVLVVCLALLAVGRVAISFAVVQKNLQTTAVAREHRRLATQNDRLRERVAGLQAATYIQNEAIGRLGLVRPASVVYLTVHPDKGIRDTSSGR